MSFRAVIFDLDGTLLDSLSDLADSMNLVLKQMGFTPHPIQDYRYFVGEGIAKLAERVLPQEERNTETINSCVERMKVRYRESWAVKTRPYPGVYELLNGLQDRGIILNILSNKVDEFTQVMVRTLLADWRFSSVKGIRPGIPRKPDPGGALSISRECGVPPRETIFLGDTHTDMETASAAGMFAVGALWGFRTRSELERSGAQALVHAPPDLLPHFAV
jgi:phosphoglycolate phosphatase